MKIVTNHQLRATAINHVIDNGFEAREICSVTGQKSEATIENYAKAPSRKRQILMAAKCLKWILVLQVRLQK